MQHKLKQAVTLAVSKHNILLIANEDERQTFIQQLFKQLPHNILTCFVDFALINNDVDVVERFYHAITLTLEQNTSQKSEPSLIGLSKFFTDANILLHQQCATLIAIYGFRELINYLFSVLSTYCQTNALSHAVVVIDDFEKINTIKQLKLDATLRNISQHNQFVSFIFTGDPVRTSTLFNRYDQPFFGSITLINKLDIKSN